MEREEQQSASCSLGKPRVCFEEWGLNLAYSPTELTEVPRKSCDVIPEQQNRDLEHQQEQKNHHQDQDRHDQEQHQEQQEQKPEKPPEQQQEQQQEQRQQQNEQPEQLEEQQQEQQHEQQQEHTVSKGGKKRLSKRSHHKPEDAASVVRKKHSRQASAPPSANQLTPAQRAYWQTQLPRGFDYYLGAIACAVITAQPENILEFCSDHLENLFRERISELAKLPATSYLQKLHQRKFGVPGDSHSEHLADGSDLTQGCLATEIDPPTIHSGGGHDNAGSAGNAGDAAVTHSLGRDENASSQQTWFTARQTASEQTITHQAGFGESSDGVRNSPTLNQKLSQDNSLELVESGRPDSACSLGYLSEAGAVLQEYGGNIEEDSSPALPQPLKAPQGHGDKIDPNSLAVSTTQAQNAVVLAEDKTFCPVYNNSLQSDTNPTTPLVYSQEMDFVKRNTVPGDSEIISPNQENMVLGMTSERSTEADDSAAEDRTEQGQSEREEMAIVDEFQDGTVTGAGTGYQISLGTIGGVPFQIALTPGDHDVVYTPKIAQGVEDDDSVHTPKVSQTAGENEPAVQERPAMQCANLIDNQISNDELVNESNQKINENGEEMTPTVVKVQTLGSGQKRPEKPEEKGRASVTEATDSTEHSKMSTSGSKGSNPKEAAQKLSEKGNKHDEESGKYLLNIEQEDHSDQVTDQLRDFVEQITTFPGSSSGQNKSKAGIVYEKGEKPSSSGSFTESAMRYTTKGGDNRVLPAGAATVRLTRAALLQWHSKIVGKAGAEPKSSEARGGAEPKSSEGDGGSESKSSEGDGGSEPKSSEGEGGGKSKSSEGKDGAESKSSEGEGGAEPKRLEGKARAEPKILEGTGRSEPKGFEVQQEGIASKKGGKPKVDSCTVHNKTTYLIERERSDTFKDRREALEKAFRERLHINPAVDSKTVGVKEDKGGCKDSREFSREKTIESQSRDVEIVHQNDDEAGACQIKNNSKEDGNKSNFQTKPCLKEWEKRMSVAQDSINQARNKALSEVVFPNINETKTGLLKRGFGVLNSDLKNVKEANPPTADKKKLPQKKLLRNEDGHEEEARNTDKTEMFQKPPNLNQTKPKLLTELAQSKLLQSLKDSAPDDINKAAFSQGMSKKDLSDGVKGGEMIRKLPLSKQDKVSSHQESPETKGSESELQPKSSSSHVETPKIEDKAGAIMSCEGSEGSDSSETVARANLKLATDAKQSEEETFVSKQLTEKVSEAPEETASPVTIVGSDKAIHPITTVSHDEAIYPPVTGAGSEENVKTHLHGDNYSVLKRSDLPDNVCDTLKSVVNKDAEYRQIDEKQESKDHSGDINTENQSVCIEESISCVDTLAPRSDALTKSEVMASGQELGSQREDKESKEPNAADKALSLVRLFIEEVERVADEVETVYQLRKVVGSPVCAGESTIEQTSSVAASQNKGRTSGDPVQVLTKDESPNRSSAKRRSYEKDTLSSSAKKIRVSDRGQSKGRPVTQSPRLSQPETDHPENIPGVSIPGLFDIPEHLLYELANAIAEISDMGSGNNKGKGAPLACYRFVGNGAVFKVHPLSASLGEDGPAGSSGSGVGGVNANNVVPVVGDGGVNHSDPATLTREGFANNNRRNAALWRALNERSEAHGENEQLRTKKDFDISTALKNTSDTSDLSSNNSEAIFQPLGVDNHAAPEKFERTSDTLKSCLTCTSGPVRSGEIPKQEVNKNTNNGEGTNAECQHGMEIEISLRNRTKSKLSLKRAAPGGSKTPARHHRRETQCYAVSNQRLLRGRVRDISNNSNNGRDESVQILGNGGSHKYDQLLQSGCNTRLVEELTNLIKSGETGSVLTQRQRIKKRELKIAEMVTSVRNNQSIKPIGVNFSSPDLLKPRPVCCSNVLSVNNNHMEVARQPACAAIGHRNSRPPPTRWLSKSGGMLGISGRSQRWFERQAEKETERPCEVPTLDNNAVDSFSDYTQSFDYTQTSDYTQSADYTQSSDYTQSTDYTQSSGVASQDDMSQSDQTSNFSAESRSERSHLRDNVITGVPNLGALVKGKFHARHPRSLRDLSLPTWLPQRQSSPPYFGKTLSPPLVSKPHQSQPSHEVKPKTNETRQYHIRSSPTATISTKKPAASPRSRSRSPRVPASPPSQRKWRQNQSPETRYTVAENRFFTAARKLSSGDSQTLEIKPCATKEAAQDQVDENSLMLCNSLSTHVGSNKLVDEDDRKLRFTARKSKTCLISGSKEDVSLCAVYLSPERSRKLSPSPPRSNSNLKCVSSKHDLPNGESTPQSVPSSSVRQKFPTEADVNRNRTPSKMVTFNDFISEIPLYLFDTQLYLEGNDVAAQENEELFPGYGSPKQHYTETSVVPGAPVEEDNKLAVSLQKPTVPEAGMLNPIAFDEQNKMVDRGHRMTMTSPEIDRLDSASLKPSFYTESGRPTGDPEPGEVISYSRGEDENQIAQTTSSDDVVATGRNKGISYLPIGEDPADSLIDSDDGDFFRRDGYNFCDAEGSDQMRSSRARVDEKVSGQNKSELSRANNLDGQRDTKSKRTSKNTNKDTIQHATTESKVAGKSKYNTSPITACDRVGRSNDDSDVVISRKVKRQKMIGKNVTEAITFEARSVSRDRSPAQNTRDVFSSPTGQGRRGTSPGRTDAQPRTRLTKSKNNAVVGSKEYIKTDVRLSPRSPQTERSKMIPYSGQPSSPERSRKRWTQGQSAGNGNPRSVVKQSVSTSPSREIAPGHVGEKEFREKRWTIEVHRHSPIQRDDTIGQSPSPSGSRDRLAGQQTGRESKNEKQLETAVRSLKSQPSRVLEFPVHLHEVPIESAEDSEEVTRVLTLEEPQKNVYVNMTFERPNPRRAGTSGHFEVSNGSKRLYLTEGADDQVQHRSDSPVRRLVCEPEAYTEKTIKDKRRQLVLENGTSLRAPEDAGKLPWGFGWAGLALPGEGRSLNVEQRLDEPPSPPPVDEPERSWSFLNLVGWGEGDAETGTTKEPSPVGKPKILSSRSCGETADTLELRTESSRWEELTSAGKDRFYEAGSKVRGPLSEEKELVSEINHLLDVSVAKSREASPIWLKRPEVRKIGDVVVIGGRARSVDKIIQRNKSKRSFHLSGGSPERDVTPHSPRSHNRNNNGAHHHYQEDPTAHFLANFKQICLRNPEILDYSHDSSFVGCIRLDCNPQTSDRSIREFPFFNTSDISVTRSFDGNEMACSQKYTDSHFPCVCASLSFTIESPSGEAEYINEIPLLFQDGSFETHLNFNNNSSYDKTCDICCGSVCLCESCRQCYVNPLGCPRAQTEVEDKGVKRWRKVVEEICQSPTYEDSVSRQCFKRVCHKGVCVNLGGYKCPNVKMARKQTQTTCRGGGRQKRECILIKEGRRSKHGKCGSDGGREQICTMRKCEIISRRKSRSRNSRDSQEWEDVVYYDDNRRSQGRVSKRRSHSRSSKDVKDFGDNYDQHDDQRRGRESISKKRSRSQSVKSVKNLDEDHKQDHDHKQSRESVDHKQDHDHKQSRESVDHKQDHDHKQSRESVDHKQDHDHKQSRESISRRRSQGCDGKQRHENASTRNSGSVFSDSNCHVDDSKERQKGRHHRSSKDIDVGGDDIAETGVIVGVQTESDGSLQDVVVCPCPEKCNGRRVWTCHMLTHGGQSGSEDGTSRSVSEDCLSPHDGNSVCDDLSVPEHREEKKPGVDIVLICECVPDKKLDKHRKVSKPAGEIVDHLSPSGETKDSTSAAERAEKTETVPIGVDKMGVDGISLLDLSPSRAIQTGASVSATEPFPLPVRPYSPPVNEHHVGFENTQFPEIPDDQQSEERVMPMTPTNTPRSSWKDDEEADTAGDGPPAEGENRQNSLDERCSLSEVLSADKKCHHVSLSSINSQVHTQDFSAGSISGAAPGMMTPDLFDKKSSRQEVVYEFPSERGAPNLDDLPEEAGMHASSVSHGGEHGESRVSFIEGQRTDVSPSQGQQQREDTSSVPPDPSGAIPGTEQRGEFPDLLSSPSKVISGEDFSKLLDDVDDAMASPDLLREMDVAEPSPFSDIYAPPGDYSSYAGTYGIPLDGGGYIDPAYALKGADDNEVFDALSPLPSKVLATDRQRSPQRYRQHSSVDNKNQYHVISQHDVETGHVRQMSVRRESLTVTSPNRIILEETDTRGSSMVSLRSGHRRESMATRVFKGPAPIDHGELEQMADDLDIDPGEEAKFHSGIINHRRYSKASWFSHE